MTPRAQALLQRLHDRMEALGGHDVAGADYEDVRRALPEIEKQAAADLDEPTLRLALADLIDRGWFVLPTGYGPAFAVHEFRTAYDRARGVES